MNLEEATNKVKSHHLFSPGDIVQAWHYHYGTLVDPISYPLDRNSENTGPDFSKWNDIEYKVNEAYKGRRIKIFGNQAFRVIRQVGDPYITQDHMADVLVASYILEDFRTGLFYSVFSSARLVLAKNHKDFVENHSFDMSHMVKNKK